MKTVHVLDDWEDDNNLHVVALHSHLEDYRLAFSFNKNLQTTLVNKHKGLQMLKAGQVSSFTIFKSGSTRNHPQFYLIGNKSIQTFNKAATVSLFSQDELYQDILVKSQSNVRYFLLSEDPFPKESLDQIKKKTHINFYLSLDFESLKQKEQSILRSILYDQ